MKLALSDIYHLLLLVLLSEKRSAYIIYFADFPDYDGEELNQISGLLARDYGYNYPPEARYEFLFSS